MPSAAASSRSSQKKPVPASAARTSSDVADLFTFRPGTACPALHQSHRARLPPGGYRPWLGGGRRRRPCSAETGRVQLVGERCLAAGSPSPSWRAPARVPSRGPAACRRPRAPWPPTRCPTPATGRPARGRRPRSAAARPCVEVGRRLQPRRHEQALTQQLVEAAAVTLTENPPQARRCRRRPLAPGPGNEIVGEQRLHDGPAAVSASRRDARSAPSSVPPGDRVRAIRRRRPSMPRRRRPTRRSRRCGALRRRPPRRVVLRMPRRPRRARHPRRTRRPARSRPGAAHLPCRARRHAPSPVRAGRGARDPVAGRDQPRGRVGSRTPRQGNGAGPTRRRGRTSRPHAGAARRRGSRKRRTRRPRCQPRRRRARASNAG